MSSTKIIRINKLFGQYDNVIDLSKRCLIFIGDNGCGKTTILNILKCISDRDFARLSKYDFESIEIQSDEKAFKLNYRDLFPDAKEFVSRMRAFSEEIPYAMDNETDEPITTYNALAEIVTEISNKRSGLLYCQYLSCCFFNKPLSAELFKKMRAIEFIRLMETPEKVIREAMQSLTREDTGILCNTLSATFFSFSKIERILFETLRDDLIRFDFIDSILHDSVKEYTFDEELTNKSHVSSRVLAFLKSYNSEPQQPIRGLPQVAQISFLFGIPYYPENIAGKMIELTQIAYQNIDYEFVQKETVKAEYISKICKGGISKINKLISRFYYDDNFVREINNLAVSYYRDKIGRPESTIDLNEWENVSFYSDPAIMEDISLYLSPIILRDSIHDFNPMIYGLTNYQTGFFDSGRMNIPFYKNEIHKVKEYKSDRIEILRTLIEKYMPDKIVKIVPAGIVFYKSNRKTRIKKNITMHENYKDEIRLNELSSGEKKLLLIFAYCVFFPEQTLIIDEPEISLSIVWQETLLPDLLNFTGVRQIIVATHSPFIASDASLFDYIIPLPAKVED